jgi:large subunit ribosomal protein L13
MGEQIIKKTTIRQRKLKAYGEFGIQVVPQSSDAKWYVVDASGYTLGRLAAKIANVIRGKCKASYTPNMDCGDHVIVINAEKIMITGNKLKNKTYWYTGYEGGLKEITWGKILSGNYPERLLENALKGMMPKQSPQARALLKSKLHVYSGSEHPHIAQKPEPLAV